IGFRVKSGYAIAVVLRGSAAAPLAVSRHLVDLADPAIEETRQPYHSSFGEAEEDERVIARRGKIGERVARRSAAAPLQAAPGAPAWSSAASSTRRRWGTSTSARTRTKDDCFARCSSARSPRAASIARCSSRNRWRRRRAPV